MKMTYASTWLQHAALAMICFLALAVSPVVAQEQKSSASDEPALPADTLPEQLHWDRVQIGQEALPPTPKDNPMTAAKVALGRKLFFDPVLSTNGRVACASCHLPEHGFASPDPVAIGVEGRRGTRNAPSLLNVAYGRTFTWDGRDATLEQQVLGPLESEFELGGDIEGMLKRLRADAVYVQQFADCFEAVPGPEVISLDNLAKAIASFERTLVTGNSAVDQFRRSQYQSMSREARQGMWIFESRGGCWKCHNGTNLTDEEFHNTGVSYGSENRDPGREKATGNPEDRFRFKTPTLRNVEHSAPYMHDGSAATLREVVEFYNRGGSQEDPLLDEKLKPLKLTEEEVGFVVEFLKALSDDGVGGSGPPEAE